MVVFEVMPPANVEVAVDAAKKGDEYFLAVFRFVKTDCPKPGQQAQIVGQDNKGEEAAEQDKKHFGY